MTVKEIPMPALVSILIPSHNAEKWIRETIESALSQTWAKNEVIVVDDGSTDSTLQILKRFRSARLKVIAQENRGACAARNTAFSLAQGDFIQWLDADDLLAVDKIAQQMRHIGSNRDSKILLSSAWAKFHYRPHAAKFIPNALWTDLDPIEWLMVRLSQNVWMPIQSWLISRTLADTAGPWDERLAQDQDGEYMCRVVAKSEMVKFVPEAKAFYRVGNTGTISTSKSDKAFESRLLSIKQCIRYMRELEKSERTRDACLRLLETELSYCYSYKINHLDKLYVLARELGGDLTPRESLKFSITRRMLGMHRAKQLKETLWNWEVAFRKNWDKLLYTISKV